MVQVNPRLILVLAILGAGIYTGGQIAGVVIENQINNGIQKQLVKPSDYNTTDPKGYANWLTNEDPGDTPKYKSYYFWNLTNADEFLNNGADPVVEQIGPFVYRQYDRKLNVVFDDDTVSYRTYTYYKFEPDMSTKTASLSDNIVNVNPAYLSVIQQAGSEDGLATSFFAPALGQLISLLQTDFAPRVAATGIATAVNTTMASLKGDFVDNVLVGATPLVLKELQSQITENMEYAVNATAFAGFLATDLGNQVADFGGNLTKTDLAFFNSTTYTTDVGGDNLFGGISEVMTSGALDLGFTNDTIRKLLHEGTGAPLNIPGWFQDFNTGTGVLGFLQAYQTAIDPNDASLDNATLQFFYGGATQQQLDAVAGYLTQYIIPDNVNLEGTFVASFSKTTQDQALENFYAQWTNNTILPGGLDINGDGNGGDGFEINLSTKSDIPLTTAEALFDASNSLSLTNDTIGYGIYAWFEAAAGNATVNSILSATFSLNDTQLLLLYNWLGGMISRPYGLSTLGAIQNFSPLGVQSTDDIAYAHWGSPVITGGISVNDIQDVGAYVEFWSWADRINGPADTFNMTMSKDLLSGEYNLTDATGVGTFQALAANMTDQSLTQAERDLALTKINLLFDNEGSDAGLNAGNVSLIMGYLNYMLYELVLKTIDPSMYNALTNSGSQLYSTLGQNPYLALAIKHWSSPAVTGNVTLKQVALTLPAEERDAILSLLPTDPEFWAQTNSALDFSDAVQLLYSIGGNRNITSIFGITNFLTSAPIILNSSLSLPTRDNELRNNINNNFGTFLTVDDYVDLVSYIQVIKQKIIIDAQLKPLVTGTHAGGLITTHTVEQWLWNGQDPLLQFISANDPTISPNSNLFSNYTSPEDPRIPAADIFNTGANQIDDIGNYEQWHGLTSIQNVWNDTVEGNVENTPLTKIDKEAITGTDATQFAPGVSRSDLLVAFVSDLYRAITLSYEDDTSQFGIKLYRFVLSPQVLAKDPVFYQNVVGLANLTIATGAPLYLSKPHFLDADPIAYNLTQGLNPDRSLHDTVIDVEPLSGVVMNARKRLQLNFHVHNDTLFTPNVKAAYVPLAWVEEGGTITEELANDFKNSIEPAFKAQNLIGNITFGVGLVLFLSAAVLLTINRRPPKV